MHTTKINKTIFHHNGDKKGDVIISVDGTEVRVTMEELKEFVNHDNEVMLLIKCSYKLKQKR